MKKKLLLVVLAVLTLLVLAACSPTPADNNTDNLDEQNVQEEAITPSVMALKGPTGVAMAKMIDDNDANQKYQFSLVGSPDEIVSAISSGEADIAAMPTNLAAKLYAKNEGDLQMISVIADGSLYLLENGNTINSLADLEGKTIYATGQGSNPQYILEYLLKQKQAGRIRHLGFSVHGQYDVMQRFLDAYGKHMEFCQIQLNYLDWDFQDAKAKVRLLNQLHIPIWVMEPLRGGRLASLSQEDTALLQKLRPGETVPGWAFRFLQSIPGVAVVLSGMSNLQQLKENIRIFEERAPLNEKETAVLLSIADALYGMPLLRCSLSPAAGYSPVIGTLQ